MNFADLQRVYRTTLLDSVIPFWTENAIAPAGGLHTCIGDDGRVVSHDFWNWSQWRAVWVFSKLYNRIDPRPEWLAIAENIYRFVSAHGPLDDGHWPLLLDGDGNIQRGYESIYVDGFAIYGLVELWRATRKDEILQKALRTFEAVQETFSGEASPPAYPFPIPDDRKNHGVSMLFSLVFFELAKAAGDDTVMACALKQHRQVVDEFLNKERGLVVEWLRRDGGTLPPPQGTVVIPGHAIESMWFQTHIARERGDRETIDRAAATILRHLEHGWDEKYGGLYWALDADGRDDVAWENHETKLWWPHTEALYATLLAYEMSGDPVFLDWHERVRRYSYERFEDREHGEWRQKLDRTGKPITKVVALPVKDPFHLPRALIYCIDVLERLARSE